MENLNKAQQAKANKTLNMLIRYEEGVMSRREWLKIQLSKGATVTEAIKNRIMFDRRKFNRLCGQEQRDYEKKTEEKVPCYELRLPNQSGYWEITKTEYDHFKDLQLAEDISTAKHDLSNRIEAGIATEEEISADMQSEIEFMNKYYTPIN